MANAADFRFFPKGSTKVSDKKSDAVAYIYAVSGQPTAIGYVGKRGKKEFWLTFKSEAAREKKIAGFFADRQAILAYKAGRKASELAKGRGAEVGQYLVASWGYDQTNVNFYKITALIGESMVEAVAVGQVSVGKNAGGSSMSDLVMPAEQPAQGAKVYRVKLKCGGGRINGNRVSTWSGSPAYTSWYA